MLTCAPLETEAMENVHKLHLAHLPHSHIKKSLVGGGSIWPKIRRSTSSHSCMFIFVLSVCSES